MSRVKLSDVAKEAGVAVSTASIVLSEGGQINEIAEKTKERVREVAWRLKYRPNAGARLIQMRQTGAVALLQSAAMDRALLPPELLYGISAELQKQNKTLSFVQLDDEAIMEFRPHFLRQNDVDGILVNYSVKIPRKLFDYISHYEIPAVYINVRKAKDAVWFDFKQAVADEVERLAAMGRRRIMLLNFSSGFDHHSLQDSRNGYLKVMEKFGLKPWIEESVVPRIDRIPVVKKLLRQTKAPDAVFAMAASSAFPVIQAANQLGIQVPEQLSVSTFGSLQETTLLVPHADFISLPWRQAGQRAVQMLLNKIEGKRGKPISGRLACEWRSGATAK